MASATPPRTALRRRRPGGRTRADEEYVKSKLLAYAQDINLKLKVKKCKLHQEDLLCRCAVRVQHLLDPSGLWAEVVGLAKGYCALFLPVGRPSQVPCAGFGRQVRVYTRAAPSAIFWHSYKIYQFPFSTFRFPNQRGVSRHFVPTCPVPYHDGGEDDKAEAAQGLRGVCFNSSILKKNLF